MKNQCFKFTEFYQIDVIFNASADDRESSSFIKPLSCVYVWVGGYCLRLFRLLFGRLDNKNQLVEKAIIEMTLLLSQQKRKKNARIEVKQRTTHQALNNVHLVYWNSLENVHKIIYVVIRWQLKRWSDSEVKKLYKLYGHFSTAKCGKRTKIDWLISSNNIQYHTEVCF